MKKRKVILFLLVLMMISSCGIAKTHHKNQLINFEDNTITSQILTLDGYYYAELERDVLNTSDNIKSDVIKYLSVFFIYKDGFVVHIDEINGLSNYYCAEKELKENTYENAHEVIELMLQSQNSEEKRIKRICDFNPNDISNKGLAEIEKDSLKIQYYRMEGQSPRPDSFNSYYLYELNGIIKSDTSFMVKSKTAFRENKTKIENITYKFKQTDKKPKIDNFFKKNKKQFR
ncbi:hypothetical protein [Winogradskyella forsetii]|uniref:hypothetical protein n=1 Tax=Winogradskyella forsetii TaxID=2686077 RepID=UPI0015BD2C25|nr:hypothetical protein [Winogradskyella forsetii]